MKLSLGLFHKNVIIFRHSAGMNDDIFDDDPLPIGFYSWQGDPCRIVADKDGLNGRRAEMYVGGKGYVEIDAGDLFINSVLISEQHFKKLVIQEIDLTRPNETGIP